MSTTLAAVLFLSHRCNSELGCLIASHALARSWFLKSPCFHHSSGKSGTTISHNANWIFRWEALLHLGYRVCDARQCDLNVNVYQQVSPPGLNHEVPTTLKHQSGVLTNSRRSMRKRSPILRKSMQKSPPTFKFTSRLSDCCSKRDKGDRCNDCTKREESSSQKNTSYENRYMLSLALNIQCNLLENCYLLSNQLPR